LQNLANFLFYLFAKECKHAILTRKNTTKYAYITSKQRQTIKIRVSGF